MRPMSETGPSDNPSVAHAHDGVGYSRGPLHCAFAIRIVHLLFLRICVCNSSRIALPVAVSKIARGLVGENKAWTVHQRARYCHALHLSPGKLVHHAVRQPCQADIGNALQGSGTSFSLRLPAAGEPQHSQPRLSVLSS